MSETYLYKSTVTSETKCNTVAFANLQVAPILSGKSCAPGQMLLDDANSIELFR